MTGISLPSVNRIYLKIGQRPDVACERSSPLNGSIKGEESYFGAHGKTFFFFGLYSSAKATVQGIIWGHIYPASVIHSDVWPIYDRLVYIGFEKHFWVNHGANEFAAGERHINGFESFWSWPNKRMAKFNRLSKRTCYMQLNVTEFLLNQRVITFTSIFSKRYVLISFNFLRYNFN